MASLGLSINKYYVNKDGSYRIRVTLYHKEETVYINTPYTVESEKQWSNGKIVRSAEASFINAKLRRLVDKYQDALDEIPNIGILSCKQLKEQILRRCNCSDSMTLHACACMFIERAKEEKSADYVSMLSLSLRYIDECFGNDYLLSEITPYDITEFSKWIKHHTKAGASTESKYLSHLKVFINFGIKNQFVTYQVHPFATTKITRSAIKEDEDISLDSFISIRDAVLANKRDCIARDLFLLSFYLGGINLIDIVSLDFKDKTELEYVRTKIKSRAQVKVCIPITQQAADIIGKYMDSNGRLNFGLNGSYKTFRHYMCVGVKSVAEKCNVKENITFYSARKTFSQFASEIGIPNAVIDYCIGHSQSGNGVIAHYVKVRKKQAEIAINRVIDYTEHPDNYKEFIELRQDIMMAKL